MRCILIFDNLNDILYFKGDRSFLNHMKNLGKLQGLISDGKDEEELSPNVIIQLFSPIVTSQRVMNCQFGNAYSSVQCQDGTKMVFDEYMGYLFVHIGVQEVSWLKWMQGVCITLVKHICGPDVSLLKRDKGRAGLLTRLLDAWLVLQDTDQAVLVEAVEQLIVNTELSLAALRALQEATDRLRALTDFSKAHAMVLVDNKFLGLYSSRNAQDLSASDVMFLSLLAGSHRVLAAEPGHRDCSEAEDGGESSDEFYSPQASPQCSPAQLRKEYGPAGQEAAKLLGQEQGESRAEGLASHVLLLMAGGRSHNPHVVHIAPIKDGVYLLLLLETGISGLSSGLHEVFHHLNIIQNVQMQKDTEGIKHAFENLDGSMKKLLEILRKSRMQRPDVENCHKKLQTQWDFIRKKYIEHSKTSDLDCILRIESSTNYFVETLKALLKVTCFDGNFILYGQDAILSTISFVKHKLSDFSEFLKVKALRNFTLGSRASLTINKYLEEFPGLVHFIYVDRTNHRVTTPSLDFSSEETITLTKKKIWTMVEFSRKHLQEGHFALMWKDTTFNYAYFLWFEDASGCPLKVKVFPTAALKSFPRPGILCGDFYQRLTEACFPKAMPGKVRCYELYCIHLGLATSSCVLEHSRRLAATIWEVTGAPKSPLDIL
ncbi:BLOC-3 complex member HPS1 [Bacillus rossius redtenbacheri]|uniref:BLOC-3 complex member HPS1 n=1 Tax=Bacillus rossius redtenbacheri TaxID=93214 RepID=UPI002FDE5065